jgi:kynurenine/2-aminoadipate aminotransferase
LIEKIQLHQQVYFLHFFFLFFFGPHQCGSFCLQGSVLHTSGISQAIVLALLEKWGFEGLDKQKENVQKFYTKQRDALIQAAEKHLKGLAEWEVPVAGMFLWIRLLGVEDTFDLIRKKAVTEKVLFVPGRSFVPGGANSPYIRASFSTATPEQMDIAMSRLAGLLRSSKNS